MTRTSLAAVAMLMSAVAVEATRESSFALQSSAATVQIPVSVRDGTRPVSGLTAADFVLTDNDVAQQVEVATIEVCPRRDADR